MEIHSLQNYFGNECIVFEIEVSDNENVFMSIPATNDDERYVVLVNTEKFLNLWRNEPNGIHSNISMGDINTWKNDYKYHYAVDGFAEGFKNPVPLASISFHQKLNKVSFYKKRFFFFKSLIKIEENLINYISFTNGITRTIWLFAHGVESFPVECLNPEGAKKLAMLAGHGKDNCKSLRQLLESTS